jgi:uncharacterized protein
MPTWCASTCGCCRTQVVETLLQVKVAPKAARTAVVGWIGDTLKLSVTAAPENGRANEAVILLLAEVLRCPRSTIGVRRGATTARKLIAIDGLSEDEVRRRLQGCAR